MSKAIGGDCWCDLWGSFYQNPSWMGAFNHGGEPVGRALVSSLVTPQIGEFSFVLTTSVVASGIFTSFQSEFLLAVIAASLFFSPLWSGVLRYLVICYRIHNPVALPSSPAEPE